MGTESEEEEQSEAWFSESELSSLSSDDEDKDVDQKKSACKGLSHHHHKRRKHGSVPLSEWSCSNCSFRNNTDGNKKSLEYSSNVSRCAVCGTGRFATPAA